jgi:hypothetical protein
MASQSGIGRLAVVESPDAEPALGTAIALGPINSIAGVTAPSSSTTTS